MNGSSNNQHFGGVGAEVVVYVNKYGNRNPNFHINSNQHNMERYLLTRIGLITSVDLDIVDEW